MMNTLMTLAVIDSCCVEVCKHCSQTATKSVWYGFINESFPNLLWGILWTIIVIFLIKYGIEYVKLYIQNKKNKAELERKELLKEIKDIIDSIIPAIKKEGIVIEKLDENINAHLRKNIELLEKSIKVSEELNKKMSNKQICEHLEKLLNLSDEQKEKIKKTLNGN